MDGSRRDSPDDLAGQVLLEVLDGISLLSRASTSETLLPVAFSEHMRGAASLIGDV